MPPWLQKKENYIPRNDRDTFINKSILSFLWLIARIKAQGKIEDRFRVNAFFRVLFTLLLAVLVSLSKTFSFVYLVIAYQLIILCFMPGKDIYKIMCVSLSASFFTALILLPSLFYGNTYSVFIIPVKVLVSVMAVNILSYTTRWDQITMALKRFHAPDILIFILDITLKYIFMLGEFSVEMLCALRLRSVGKSEGRYGALSGAAGTLFLKSREMSEELYSAMECRGFTGEYQIYQKFRFQWADFIYLLINAGIVCSFIYLYGG